MQGILQSLGNYLKIMVSGKMKVYWTHYLLKKLHLQDLKKVLIMDMVFGLENIIRWISLQ